MLSAREPPVPRGAASSGKKKRRSGGGFCRGCGAPRGRRLRQEGRKKRRAGRRLRRNRVKLTDIRGISEKREKDLNKLNIFTPEDLVRDFPRAYLDLTQ